MSYTLSEAAPVVFRWLGRGLAVLLLLFWGAFFVEHLMGWFVAPRGGLELPPARVWIGQVLHFLMLVGLTLMLRWERLGAAWTVLATPAFFAVIGLRTFPVIALINLLPVVCFALAAMMTPRRMPTAP